MESVALLVCCIVGTGVSVSEWLIIEIYEIQKAQYHLV